MSLVCVVLFFLSPKSPKIVTLNVTERTKEFILKESKLDLTEDGQMYIVFEKDGKYERKILTLNT